jgi:NADH-quinone oxidoreductase subunit E
MPVVVNECLDKRLLPVFDQFTSKPEYLIPLLQAVQNELGYLPSEAIERVSNFLKVPISNVYGVVTFYTQFYLTPQGRHKIKICQGTACHVRGAKKLTQAVQSKLGVGPGETTEDGEFSVERVACIGSCALAPAVVGDGKIHGPMTSEKVESMIDDIRDGSKES